MSDGGYVMTAMVLVSVGDHGGDMVMVMLNGIVMAIVALANMEVMMTMLVLVMRDRGEGDGDGLM